MNTINNTVLFVKHTLQNAEGGHDWFHIERVWNTSKLIAKNEPSANLTIIELAALLHDIADSKFHNGDETIGPSTAKKFLQTQQVDEVTITHVLNIIQFISFKGGNHIQEFTSLELQIVQDADRLDAIGAIGIARAFSYGGFKNRELFNPETRPQLNMTKEEYKSSTAPTINHFYEKLLLLTDGFHTNTAKQLSKQRHTFLKEYLNQFYTEWYANDLSKLPCDFHLEN